MSAYVSDVHEIDRLLSGRKDAPIVLYCNGPFCGKSKRLAEELLQAGFTDIRRYQLGAPVWRALGGVMQIEPASFQHVLREDRTAVIFDAWTAGEFAAGTLEGARHLPKEEVVKAKDDGRLPMEDHNTRIVVFADSAATAAPGEVADTYTLIITDANAIMRVHDLMPVILATDAARRWLEPGPLRPEPLRSMML